MALIVLSQKCSSYVVGAMDSTAHKVTGLSGHCIWGGALSAVRAQCNYLGVWPY